ncbi:MAG: hypothetical protein HGB17_03180 [Syntrophobacteraceae bacterium]|nr:hypothetical protein [Syntrophobacteraceae bacterium]
MHMDRDIFNLKASTDATSLYILICALKDLGQSPTLPEIRAKWTGNEESLRNAVKELMRRGVLDATHSMGQDEPFAVQARAEWI